MNKLSLLVVPVLSLFITGCTSEAEPVIQKAEPTSEEELSEPVIIEEKIDKEDLSEFIEFQVEDEVLRLNLKAIPILDQYLTAVPSRKQAVEAMQIEKLLYNEDVFLIEFSCSHDLCSYLLINQKKDDQAYLIADLAKYESTNLSPDHSKFILKFSRTTSEQYPFVHNIVVVDLDSWSILSLENEQNETISLDYKLPYTTVEWLDNKTISVTTEEVTEGDEEKTSEQTESTTILQTKLQ